MFSGYQELSGKFDFACATKGKLWYYGLGLVGEAGEVADKIKKHYRDETPLDVSAIVKELGDVLWYVATMARLLGVNLKDVAIANLNKLEIRARRGTLGGSGDNR
jgi:NTP pyrophosphatase (non-canonical NTP hydrolase)